MESRKLIENDILSSTAAAISILTIRCLPISRQKDRSDDNANQPQIDKLYTLAIFILLMSKEIRWEHREAYPSCNPNDKNVDVINLYIQRKVGSHLRPKIGGVAKLEKQVTAYEKEIERRRELENKCLQRRISEIQRRRRSLGQQEEEQKRLYTLNMVARKWQREKQEQSLQQQNDIIVERIVRMRSSNGPLSLISHELSKSQARRKGSNRSLLLPRIEEYEVDI